MAIGREQAGQSTEDAAIRRAMEVIEVVRKMGGAEIDDFAPHFDCTREMLESCVSTLCDTGYLVREGDEYAISTLFVRLGSHARRRYPNKLAAEKVSEIAERSGERAAFAIKEGDRVVFTYRRNGEDSLDIGSKIGQRRYLHTNASGKLHLADLEEDEIDAVIDRCGLPAKTEHTITNRETLLGELEEIRERGYAFNLEENIDGLHVVAAPIRAEDEMVGALSISGPSTRLRGERLQKLAEIACEAATELEINIQFV